MSAKSRLILLALGILVVAAGAAAIAGATGGRTPSTVRAATVVVRHAKPVGGVRTVRFKAGRPIDLTVKSDTADEIHFHGYDIGKDVRAGGRVHFRMPATIQGTFEVELERRKQQIAHVEVVP